MDDGGAPLGSPARPHCCGVRRLPTDRHVTASIYALAVNHRNAGTGLREAATTSGVVLRPEAAVAVVAKFWAPGTKIPVEFLDHRIPVSIINRVLEHANAWNNHANIEFVYAPEGTGHVRVGFDRPGYWSLLGTDCLATPNGETTLNLEGFQATGADAMPEPEWVRVVRHEFGHALGFEHEQERPDVIGRLDRAKVIAYYEATQGWSEAEVVEQVLTPLKMDAMLSTAEDDRSIMMYPFPSWMTIDGKPIPGGADITARDAELAARIYPK